MSNFLAIDTSSKHLTVYARRGDSEVLRHLDDCAMRHSEVLMDEIDRALSEAELTPAGCDYFAVVTGPGSFTGIRIGIATAKGFALATGKPLHGVTAFELIAYNVDESSFCAVIDAGRGFYYACDFISGQRGEPRYTDSEGLGSLPLYGFEELSLDGYKRVDIAKGLKIAADNLAGKPAGKVGALYIRKSQAEENLKL